jgi:hypothetical protein
MKPLRVLAVFQRASPNVVPLILELTLVFSW